MQRKAGGAQRGAQLAVVNNNASKISLGEGEKEGMRFRLEALEHRNPHAPKVSKCNKHV